jgi:hypothetical protein
MFPDRGFSGNNRDADGAPEKEVFDGGNGSGESINLRNGEEDEENSDRSDHGSEGGSDRSSSGHAPAGDGNDGSGSSDRDDERDDDAVGEDGDDDDEDAVGNEEEEEEEEEESVGDQQDGEVVAAAAPQGAPQGGPLQGNWLSYENLMAETYPAKSKEVYLAAYRDFELFLKSEDQFEKGVIPTETMILNYFRYLKVVKHWQPTTIWSQYSRLNGVVKRRFKFSLKEFPSLTDLLKSYEVGHRVKKANVFTPQQA